MRYLKKNLSFITALEHEFECNHSPVFVQHTLNVLVFIITVIIFFHLGAPAAVAAVGLSGASLRFGPPLSLTFLSPKKKCIIITSIELSRN